MSLNTTSFFLKRSFLRRVHHSSVCSPPKSTCSSWSCMGGTSWTRESGIRAASRRTSTPLAQFLKRSCASTTPPRWDASPSAWYPALPSAPRPSLWCPSKAARAPARFKHCWLWPRIQCIYLEKFQWPPVTFCVFLSVFCAAWVHIATMRAACPVSKTTSPWPLSLFWPPLPCSTRRPCPPSLCVPTRCTQTL